MNDFLFLRKSCTEKLEESRREKFDKSVKIDFPFSLLCVWLVRVPAVSTFEVRLGDGLFVFLEGSVRRTGGKFDDRCFCLFARPKPFCLKVQF